MKPTPQQSEDLGEVEEAPELVERNEQNNVEGDGQKHHKEKVLKENQKKKVAKENKKKNNVSTKIRTGERASAIANEKRMKRKRPSREEIAKARYTILYFADWISAHT